MRVMPSAATLAHSALLYTAASKTSRMPSSTVARPGERTTIATAPSTAVTATAVSSREARSARRRVPSSRRLGVRRNSALDDTRPRRHASVTTQLSANQTRSARSASPTVHPVVARIAQRARVSPVAANARGMASTAAVNRRSGSWWWRAVATAVAMSSRVKHAVSTSPNHCSAPSR